MNVFSRLRQWWIARRGVDDAPWDGDTPAWLLSLLMHMGVLVALTLVVIAQPPKPELLSVESRPVEPEDPLTTSEEFEYSEMPQDEIGASSVGEADASFALAPTLSLEPTPAQLEVEDHEVFTEPVMMGEEIQLATGPKFAENLTVKGAAGIGAVGTAGAIDWLTQEIVNSLEERPTLIVWLFDQSGSLERQRGEIIERFDRIYEELGVIEASQDEAFARTQDKPLLTSIAGFGQNVTFLTPRPTDDIEEIRAAVQAIKTDPSGVEHTFGAIAAAIDRYRPLRTQEPRRNVLIMLLTDEVGDDEAQLDRTVSMAQRLEIPIYCVGVPAPFGRQNVSVKYVDPDPKYDQSPQWIPVRQGPESYLPELVQIGDERDDAIDSGFGPYSLTRLCYETGGAYLAVHPNRDGGKFISRDETAILAGRLRHFFDPDVMRNYRPDYVSIKDYQRLLAENAARKCLVQAAQMSWLTPMDRPRTNFVKRDDADFVNQLSRAQQDAAVLEPKINQIYEVLLQGQKARPQLTTPRWQAGYDLSLGRILAMKVRTEGYNVVLAQAKNGLRFKDQKNNTWRLVRSDKITTGSVHEKQAAQALELLKHVRSEHPDTPWALLAKEELDQPLGWKWEEDFTEQRPPSNRPAARSAPPKERRPPPKL